MATTGAINGEVAIDFPNIQGMSGGICVRSFLRVQEGITQRLCRDFGVVWGAERVFDNLNNLIDLKSIISTIQ